MKKILLTVSFFITALLALKAQDAQPADDNEGQKKIQALYVAYITKELNLTAEEAQKFWPIHTQFTNEVRGVKQDLPELEKQQAILNIKKKYQDKFNPVIGNKRCERFFKMDGEFRRKLLDRIRKQRQEGRRPQVRRGV
jgi:Spy/CpxP family protein refolding chaperone